MFVVDIVVVIQTTPLAALISVTPTHPPKCSKINHQLAERTPASSSRHHFHFEWIKFAFGWGKSLWRLSSIVAQKLPNEFTPTVSPAAIATSTWAQLFLIFSGPGKKVTNAILYGVHQFPNVRNCIERNESVLSHDLCRWLSEGYYQYDNGKTRKTFNSV